MAEKNLEPAVKRCLQIEIPHWQNGGDNFTSYLFELIRKADPSNRHKISQLWPAEVEAYRRWEAEQIKICQPLIEQLMTLLGGGRP